MIKQAEESAKTTGESKPRFKRLGFIFGAKDKPLRNPIVESQMEFEDNQVRQSFSSFFDSKSSVFAMKPSKSEGASPAGKHPTAENDRRAASP